MGDELSDFPEVPPELRPCELPHDGRFDQAARQALEARGWTPVDIRFLHGVRQVKLTLDAAMRGTAMLNQEQRKALELAAKLYLDKRTAESDSTKKKDTVDVAALLSATGHRPMSKDNDSFPELIIKQPVVAPAATAQSDLTASLSQTKRRGGRPKGSTDKVPRRLAGVLAEAKRARALGEEAGEGAAAPAGGVVAGAETHSDTSGVGA